MVKRVIIGRSGAERLVDMIEESARHATAGHTRPGGNKVLEPGEDYYWSRPDGSSHSIREVDEGLAMAESRIEEAEIALDETGARLDAAEAEVSSVREDLDNIDFEGGSNNFYQPEPPLPTDDPAPSEGSLWFDTNDQNKPYIFRNGEWLSARDESFLSTARNLTPWDPGAGDVHALNGQMSTTPGVSMKGNTGIYLPAPDLSVMSILVEGVEENASLSATVALPFQGSLIDASDRTDHEADGTEIPFEARPISVAGSVLFKRAGGLSTPSLIIAARFFDVEGNDITPLAGWRAVQRSRELDMDDPAEAAFADFYGATHIAVLDDVLDATPRGAVSFAMRWHIGLPRMNGNWAVILSAEARVQVPESGIADGAITTGKIAAGAITADSGIIGSIDAGTITSGEMESERLKVNDTLAARIVQAMEVETKKLVVTEEAILNHATLIGQTVVDDINVQGKLIGTDGVFTGTVDFANVNVTGELLADQIGGNTLQGVEVVGGRLRTAETDGAYIDIHNDARAGWPAVAFSTPGMTRPAALSAYDGHQSDAGVWENGALVMNSGSMLDDYSTAVAAAPRRVRLVARGPDDTVSTFNMTSAHTYMMNTETVSIQGLASRYRDVGDARGSIALGSGVDGTISQTSFAQLDLGRGVAIMSAHGKAFIIDLNGLKIVSDETAISGSLTVASQHDFGDDYSFSIGGDILRKAAGSTRVTAGGSLHAQNDLQAQRLITTSAPTTSSAANVRAQAGTGVLYVNTSSRRYKKNIADWSPSPEAVLGLQPRQWQHDDPRFPEDIDERWHVGFIAEEVHDLGLKGLVDYWHDGKDGWRPEALNYDRFAAAQQVVLQKHEAEIAELRERIALLEAQIGAQ